MTETKQASNSSSSDDGDGSRSTHSSYRRHQIGCFLLLFLCMVFLISVYQEDAEYLSEHEEDVDYKSPSHDIKSLEKGDDGNAEVVDQFWYAPTKTVSTLMSNLAEARERLDRMLEEDYGEYAKVVFNKTEIYNVMLTESMDKIKRRLQLKVIEAQLRYMGELSKEDDASNVTFRYYTGGHSAAAGHGNLFRQNSYVKLGETVMDSFASVGIEFISENRAMGGYGSGPEIALCMEAIFGRDIDAISWDYGMTDGRDSRNYWLWSARAGVVPTMPIVILNDGRRGEVNDELQKTGVAAVKVEDLLSLKKKLPHSDEVSNVDDLPPAVKWYICENAVEGKEPCNGHKFATDECNGKVKAQVGWHNGWKDHLFIGRFIGVFFVETLIEAVAELAADNEDAGSPAPAVSVEYYNHLRSLEESDRELFLNSVPSVVESYKEIGDGIFSAAFRGNIYCHSSLLPSTARFQGLTDGTLKKAVHHYGGYYTDFDVGTPRSELPKPDPDTNDRPLILTYSPQTRQTCESGDILENDHKDWFSVQGGDGWVSTILPNDAEINAYKWSDVTERRGSIVLCTLVCDWGKCAHDYVKVDEGLFRNETVEPSLEIRIDDQVVESATKMGGYCYVLTGKDSSQDWGPGKQSAKGQYKLEFKVKPGLLLYLNSIIFL